MATTKVRKDERPELFENSRPQFAVAVVCDCGWHGVASDDSQLENMARVHRQHFCPNRCS